MRTDWSSGVKVAAFDQIDRRRLTPMIPGFFGLPAGCFKDS